MFRFRANRWVTGVVVLGLAAVSALTAQAAVVTWTGTADSTWDNTGNWSTGAVPQGADVAAFNSASTSNLSTITLDNSNRSVAGLQETTPGGDITIIAGNTLNLGASGIDMSASTHNLTINCNVGLTASQTWTVSTGMTLAVSGAVSGASGLTKTGAGLLTLSGSNAAFTGGTAVSGGTLVAASDSALGGGSLILSPTSGAATLAFTSATPSIGSLASSGSGSSSVVLGNAAANSATLLTVGANNAGTTFSGTISDLKSTASAAVGGLVKTGIGALTLTGSNTYTGNTVIAAGVLQIGNGGSGEYLASPTISNSATLVFDHADALTYAGSISGPGSVYKTGPGLLVLSGSNTLSGGVTIGAVGNWAGVGLISSAGTFAPNSSGGIVIANSAALQNAALYTYTGDPNNTGISFLFAPGVTSGTIGSIGSYGQGPLNLMTTDATPLPVNLTVGGNNASTTWAGAVWSYTITGATALSSAGTLTKVGSGALTMSEQYGNDVRAWSWQTGYSANVFENLYGLNLVGGEVVYNNVGFLPGFSNPISQGTYGAIKFSGGLFGINFVDSNSWDNQAISNEVVGANFNGGIDTIQAAETLSLSTQLTGTGGFTKAGAGTVVLSGNNSYNGGTAINGGVLSLGSPGAVGTGNISFGGGTMQFTSANTTDYSARITGSSGPISIDTNGQTVNFGSPIVFSNTGGLVKAGSGTLTLSAGNSYLGGTTVSGGTLVAASNSALGSGAGAVVLWPSSGTAALDFTSAAPSIGSLASGGSGSASVVLGSAVGNTPTLLTAGANNSSTTFSGAISDLSSAALGAIGSLAKTGSGILTLTGVNTYSGSTAVNQGTLEATSAASLPGYNLSNKVSVAGSATLAVQTGNGTAGWSSTQIGSLLGDAGWANNTTVFGIDTTNGNFTYGGNITQTLGLTKLGANTLTLTGANTYSGVTVINGGILSLGSTAAIGGGSIIFGGGTLQFTPSNTTDYSARITGSSGPISIDTNGQAVRFGSSIASSNTAGLVKIGNGTLTLGANNSYTGGTTVSGGTLVAASNSALGGGSVILSPSSGTATLDFTSSAPLIGSLASGGSGSASVVLGSAALNTATLLTVGGNNSSTIFSGAISDLSLSASAAVGSLTMTGSGTLTLTGVNTYSGTTTVAAGLLDVAGTASLPGYSTPGFVTVAGGATLAVQPSSGTAGWTSAQIGSLLGSVAWSNSTAAFGIDTTNGSYTYSGNLTNPIGLNKLGANILTLTGSNTYSGATTVSAGGLSVASTASLPGYNTPGSVTMAGGAILAVQPTSGTISGWTSAQIASLLGSVTWTNSTAAFGFDTTSGNYTYSGSIAPAQSLAKLGSNTLLLTGSNTYAGATIVSGGTLQLGDGTSPNDITLNTSSMTNNAAVVYNVGGSQAANYSISGSGSLTKLGGGTLTLGSANSFSGPTTIGSASAFGSVIQLNNGAALQNSAVVIYGKGVDTWAQDIQFGPGVTTATFASLASQGPNPFPLYTTANTPLTTAGGVTLTVGDDNTSTSFGGVFWGTGTLVKTGTGTFCLTDNNGNDYEDWQLAGFPYVCNVSYVIAGGELSMSTVRPVPRVNGGFSPAIVFQGGMFQFTGLTTNSWDLAMLGTNQIQGTNFNGGFDITQAAMSLPVNATLTGTGSFTKAGAGTVTLDGGNSYSGGTTVTGGLLQVGAANALGGQSGSGPLTVTSGILDLNGYSQTVSALSGGGGGTITNDGGSNLTLTVSQSGTTTFSGTLTDGAPAYGSSKVALAKTGTGMLVLAGANTYSGGTTISGGTLQLGNNAALGTLGATSGSLAIGAAGTLDLNGFNLSGYNALPALTGVGTITDSSTATSILAVKQSATTTFSGTLSGGLELLKPMGNGTLVLTGSDNTYTGGTEVDAGTLEVTYSDTIPYESSLTVGTNGKVVFVNLSGAGASMAQAETFAAPHGAAVAAVPEPGTLALLAAGIVAAATAWRRRTSGMKSIC